MGWRFALDGNTDLVLNTHFSHRASPRRCNRALGLYFTDKPATLHPILLQMENDRGAGYSGRGEGFCGERRVHAAGERVAAGDLSARALSGERSGGVGDAARREAETLIHISQLGFELAGGVSLHRADDAAGGDEDYDAVCVRQFGGQCAQSESSAARVVAGNRASDEMAHLWLQVLPTEGRVRRGGRSARADSGGDGAASFWRRIRRILRRTTIWRHCCKCAASLRSLFRAFWRSSTPSSEDATANNALGAGLLAMDPQPAKPYLICPLHSKFDPTILMPTTIWVTRWRHKVISPERCFIFKLRCV